MKTQLYTIQTLTNLHVGSGDINFDIIDNQVQRDAITNLPNINSSSLKGAFREHFSSKDDTKNLVEYIFGPDNKNNDSHQTGAYSFFEAQLLTRPVRSNKKAYFNATSPAVIKNLLEMIGQLKVDFDENLKAKLKEFSDLKPNRGEPMIFENLQSAILEDDEAIYSDFDISTLEEFLGKGLALFSDADFKVLDLPVVARNYLENGESKNLWYEEIVPKGSRFYFFIAKPQKIDEKDKKDKIDGFDRRFENEGDIVQIGANKSVGYGFCQVKRV